MDRANEFHEALIKVYDIAKNGTRNTAAWNDVLDVVNAVLDRSRREDKQEATPRVE